MSRVTGFRHFVEGGGGYVYLVRDTLSGLHKVGQTIRLADRLKLLASGTTADLLLVWYIRTNHVDELERAWLSEWAARRVVGEWHDLSDEQVAHFKSFRAVGYIFDGECDAYVPEWDPFDPPRSPKGRRKNPLPPIRVGQVIPRRKTSLGG